jgi:hypothetical protein
MYIFIFVNYRVVSTNFTAEPHVAGRMAWRRFLSSCHEDAEITFNPSKTTGYFLCFVWISEQTAIISLCKSGLRSSPAMQLPVVPSYKEH